MPPFLRDTLDFLTQSLADFLILLLMARFYLQAARLPFQNPVGQFVLALTNWAVLPLRRAIKPWRQYDLASLLVALFVAYSMHLLLLWYAPWNFPLLDPLLQLVLLATALLELFKMSLYLLFTATLIQALLSWFAPYHPLMPIFNGLTAPFLRPLRRVIPPIGGVDISALVLLMLVQLLLNVFINNMSKYLLALIPLGAGL